jgi:lipopolysaccharide assembly outer membrane protein LptD (OstA)
MKLLMLTVAMACPTFALASQSVSQETKAPPQRLHFGISFPQGRPVLFDLTASSAKRVLSGAETESVLQLRGNVEVRMTTCPAKGHGCVTSPMVLHADAIDYNEKTGEMAAHGNVHTIFIGPSPEPHPAHDHAPEPLQRPVLARATSVPSQ